MAARVDSGGTKRVHEQRRRSLHWLPDFALHVWKVEGVRVHYQGLPSTGRRVVVPAPAIDVKVAARTGVRTPCLLCGASRLSKSAVGLRAPHIQVVQPSIQIDAGPETRSCE